MKTVMIIFLAITSMTAYGQQKPKTKEKEKAPTQSEIDSMMKEAQIELNKMSPEDKKMMDSMGIKMPGLGSLPKFTDQQYQDGMSAGEFLIPKKDLARISIVRMKPMSNSELVVYIKSTTAKVEQRMDAKKLAAGKEAYAALKAKYKEPGAISTAASGYWMLGVLQPAIYLMGRACQDDPANPDHLNNYAAFLTMARAEELALPMLIKLNKDYPKNSTILNNMGHAWLGLGDVERAEKYLDSAIALFPNHSQANFTKAHLANARGNTQGAVTATKKSIQRAYSESKKSMLDDLNYKMKAGDLRWGLRMPQNPLIVPNYEWPQYPTTVDQSVALQGEWNAYVAKLRAEGDSYLAKQKIAEPIVADAMQKRIQEGLKNKDIGHLWLAKKASLMLDYTLTAKGGAMSKLKQKEIELEMVHKRIDALNTTKGNEMSKIHEKFRPQMGEGKPNPFAAYCAALKGAQDAYLGSANPILEPAYKEYLDAYQKMVNEKVYYMQYLQFQEEFEVTKLNEQARWVGALSAYPIFEYPDQSVCPRIPAQPSTSSKTLGDFNDLHCNTVIEFNILIANWKKSCDKSYIEAGVGPINFNLAYNDWKEEIIRGSVEIGASKSIGNSNGPLKAELEGKLAGFIEFDKEGVTDVGVAAGVEAKAGVEVKTGSEVIESVGTDLISVGVTSRIGWNSGGSVNVFNN